MGGRGGGGGVEGETGGRDCGGEVEGRWEEEEVDER